MDSVIKKDIGKLFRNVHTYYVIETQPQGWRVERRYKDMLKLRACLGNFFPGYVVSHIISQPVAASDTFDHLRGRERGAGLFRLH